MDIWILVGNFV